jgi:hypothetical protein
MFLRRCWRRGRGIQAHGMCPLSPLEWTEPFIETDLEKHLQNGNGQTGIVVSATWVLVSVE